MPTTNYGIYFSVKEIKDLKKEIQRRSDCKETKNNKEHTYKRLERNDLKKKQV